MTVEYDQPVDVLMVVMGDRMPVEGDGRDGGIELDYSIETGLPCGAKVIGYKKYGWPAHMDALANILAEHLGVSHNYLVEAIESCVAKRGGK